MQQDAFSKHDFTCPLEKTVGMMKCIVTYFELAKKAIVETSKKADKITYSFLKNETQSQFNGLKNMKFQIPTQSKQ